MKPILVVSVGVCLWVWRPDAAAIAQPGVGALASASPQRILIQVQDLEHHPLSGFRVTFAGVESETSNRAGAAQLDLPTSLIAGQPIKVVLLPGAREKEGWFLVNEQLTIAASPFASEVFLMKRSDMRAIADVAARAGYRGAARPSEVANDERERVLEREAARRGMSRQQLETAIDSFGKSGNEKDRGIAAYLKSQFPQAETLLSRAAEERKGDLADTLRYLGATQIAEGKYGDAARSFRMALALRPDDSDLLSWLGNALFELAEWPEAEKVWQQALGQEQRRWGPAHPEVARELNNLALLLQATDRLADAEPLLRRAQAIDEQSLEPQNPRIAAGLNNLAMLLKATNRLAEAEPLLRRALSIDEHSLGPQHLEVATLLDNLALLLQATSRVAEAEPLMRRALAIDERSLGPQGASVANALADLAGLLQATNRLGEAEPLMRRALAIDERSLGPQHPKVAKDLNNLASLLQTTDRLADAEPLLRRAIAIDEHSFGPQHPEVATDLNNLAELLEDTNRLAEAEPLLRRVVDIEEHSLGPQHPRVAAALGNLAQLLRRTKRLAEAEPLMRQALAINERSLGPQHPDVAICLNNLGALLRASDRRTEAEPLLRRAVGILFAFAQTQGQENPNTAKILANYRALLHELGRSESEIDAEVEKLRAVR